MSFLLVEIFLEEFGTYQALPVSQLTKLGIHIFILSQLIQLLSNGQVAIDLETGGNIWKHNDNLLLRQKLSILQSNVI